MFKIHACHYYVYFVLHFLTVIINGINHQVYSWDELLRMEQQILSLEELNFPFLITNSPLKNWTLFQELSTEHLLSNNEYFLSIFENISTIIVDQRKSNCNCIDVEYEKCNKLVPIFSYGSKNAQTHALSYWTRFETNHNLRMKFEKCIKQSNIEMSFKSFFLSLQTPTKDTAEHSQIIKHLYISSVILESDDSNYRIKTHPIIDEIDFQPFMSAFDIDLQSNILHLIDIQSHLWMGTLMSSVVTHFDLSQNLYFVVKGMKRFTLYPPSIAHFAIHPYLHSARRHQFTDMDMDTMDNYSNTNINSYEFDVKCGDILYIPPFWFHNVLNMDSQTVAINLWWSSEIQIRAAHIWGILIPIEEYWNANRKLKHILYYFQHVIHQWCEYSQNQSLKNSISFCSQNNFEFLLGYYSKIYGILANQEMKQFRDSMTINNDWSWMQLFVDMNHIFIHDEIEFETVYFCWETEVNEKWKKSIQETMQVLINIANIGIAELTLGNAFEELLSFVIEQRTSAIPIILFFART